MLTASTYHNSLNRPFDTNNLWTLRYAIHINMNAMMSTTYRLIRTSIRLNLEGVWEEFRTSLVSFPVKHAKPITHSVFRKTAPRSNIFSGSRGISTKSASFSKGGNTSFPENVLMCGLGASETKVATNCVSSFWFRSLISKDLSLLSAKWWNLMGLVGGPVCSTVETPSG